MLNINKLFILAVSVFILNYPSGNVFASDDKKDGEFNLFNLEFFSLSKKKEDAFDTASSTYVLTAQDIRRSGANSIPEALRLVPGLQVAKIDAHKWAISARGFNAQYSNKLLVMVDGRTIYTPLFSGLFWDDQDYILQDVEKIEVIRGSGGAIWGANAVNGVINIITKNAIDTQGGYASITAGNQSTLKSEVRYGGKTEDNNHYRLYAKQRHAGEETKLDSGASGANNHDGYRQSQIGFRYDLRSIKDNKISIHGDLRNGRADNYFDLTSLSNSTTDKKSKGGNFVVNWDSTLSDKSSITLQSYFDYDQFDMGVLKRDGRTIDVDFQHFYDFTRQNQFVWGVGYRMIKDKITENALSNAVTVLDYSPHKRNDEILSAFIQDKIGLIDDKFYLTLGTKFEHNDFTGLEYQPSAKFTLYPSRNQTIWASVSQAVRTPTRGENSLGVNLPSNGTTLQDGSDQYNAEKVTAFELGYRIKPSRTSLIDVTAFFNDYDDLRTFESNGSVAIVDNMGDGKSYGAEITAKWQVMKNWRMEAGYDFLQLDLRTKSYSNNNSTLFRLDTAEGESPKNQFRLRSNYNITPKLEFDNIVYYVDSLPSAGYTEGVGGVPSYTRFDTRLGYMVNEELEFSFGVQNIADNRHQEFKNGLFANKTEVGRTVYLKTVIGF
jgi:iron complex outermembrane receptor protein